MKKIVISLFIAVLLAGTVTAQTTDNRRFNLDTVTVDGTLKLERGFIVLESGDSVYYVPSLTLYINFIDELKEGANVTVEGYALRNFIYPVKFTVAGKSYDLFTAPSRITSGEPERGMFPGFPGPMFGMRNENLFGRNFFNQGRNNFNQMRNNFNSRQNNYNNMRNNFCPWCNNSWGRNNTPGRNTVPNRRRG